jgi:hypothetical protein
LSPAQLATKAATAKVTYIGEVICGIEINAGGRRKYKSNEPASGFLRFLTILPVCGNPLPAIRHRELVSLKELPVSGPIVLEARAFPRVSEMLVVPAVRAMTPCWRRASFSHLM